MDIPDDPSTTTATTDFESGSEGFDYVYEGQRVVERKPTKESSPKRRRSPKAKPRSRVRCMCGAARIGDDFEITVFEATDTEEERHRSRPRKSRPSGPGNAFGCDDRGHRRTDKRKTADHRTRRTQAAYVEEYPESTPRPAILLREHKLLRRSSTSDARRLRDSEDHSLSSSRGRSPTGKRLPPRPARLSSKESPKHRKHHRRLDVQETHEGKWKSDSNLFWVDVCDTSNADSDIISDSDPSGDSHSDSGEPGPVTRRPRRQHGPELASAATRSSAWDDHSQPAAYSSSWPMQVGANLQKWQPKRHDHEYDSEDESEKHLFTKRNDYKESYRQRQSRVSALREQEHQAPRHQETRSPHRDRQRIPSPRTRQRTIASHPNTAEMNHGYRSVATSLCEVWQGEAEDWESPYASASDGDYESDAEQPIGLLRMEDFPPRRSSPRLLPPRGERSDFSFQATKYPPSPDFHGPSTYNLEDPAPHFLSSIYDHNQTWPAPTRNGLFLLDGPPLLLTMEPSAMTDEEDVVPSMRPPSRASHWPRSRGGPTRGQARRPLPPRSRAVSPIFSARKTREFLSPKPTRAARFDFGAWGCDTGSRSSLGLGML